MTPEEFKTVCSKLGLSTEQVVSPDDVEGDRVPLSATNDEGDKIECYLSMSGDDWILSFDISGITLDSNEFRRSDVTIEGDELVVTGVSGTRPSSGYGTAGFTNGEIRFSKRTSTLSERHR